MTGVFDMEVLILLSQCIGRTQLKPTLSNNDVYTLSISLLSLPPTNHIYVIKRSRQILAARSEVQATHALANLCNFYRLSRTIFRIRV